MVERQAGRNPGSRLGEEPYGSSMHIYTHARMSAPSPATQRCALSHKLTTSGLSSLGPRSTRTAQQSCI